jgi:hypothetical protein
MSGTLWDQPTIVAMCEEISRALKEDTCEHHHVEISPRVVSLVVGLFHIKVAALPPRAEGLDEFMESVGGRFFAAYPHMG